jgi:hypothetical protein
VTGESSRGSDHFTLVPGATVIDDNITYAFGAPTINRDGTTLPDEWFENVELLVTSLEYAGTAEITDGWDVAEWPGYGAPVRISLEDRR